MSDKDRRGCPGTLLSAALILTVVVTTGCSTSNPAPVSPAPRLPRPGETFTPFTVAPTILNVREAQMATVRAYPPELRDRRIGGTVRVHFFIDESGQVQDTRIAETSGHQGLDDAALAVAGVYRFSPALNGDEPTSVWVSFPITFSVR